MMLGFIAGVANNLGKLALIAGTKVDLAFVVAECSTLQELELHSYTGNVLLQSPPS